MEAANSPDLCLGRPRFDGQQLPPAEVLALLREAVLRDGATSACRRLGGEFAIGLKLADGRPLLVVDRFSMQTLCWHRVTANSVAWAERADAFPDGHGDLDPQAVYDYLYFHAIPSPRTMWRGVARLPPGHCLTIEQGQVVVQSYWRPSFSKPAHPNFNDLAAQFRQLLEASVARQLDGTRPACFLSGGTDSSTVAGMIGRASGRAAATFSIGFDAAGYDEMAYARIAAKAFGTDHHEYYVTPKDLIEAIPLVAASYDQPFGNSSALPAYYCALMAQQSGIGRILAGDGGDELFGGNSRYARQQVFELYSRVPAWLRSGLVEPLAKAPGMHNLALLRKVRSYVEQATLPMPRRLALYNLVTKIGPDQVLTDRMLEQIDLRAPGVHQQETWDFADAEGVLDRELAFDWRYTLGEIDIPKVRGTTQLAKLTVGFPLLDDDLVDFSMRLPASYKLKGQRLRWFFKEALRGFLPDAIITKTKHGFGLPFGTWLQDDAALGRFAREKVEGLVERKIVRAPYVEQLFVDQLAQHPGYYGEMVWILMMLAQWLEARAPSWRP